MGDEEPTFLALNPDSQLDFKRPFTAVVKVMLAVTNKHPTDPIAFKVKTTAPKSYCVRPNSGRVGPNETVEVQVLLQPMKEDPPADYRCKDKFLVQGVKIGADLMALGDSDAVQERLAKLWADAEARKKADAAWAAENFTERKLKVAFLPPDAPKANGALPKAPTLTLPDAGGSLLSAAPTSYTSAKATITPADADEDAAELAKARNTIQKLQKELSERDREMQGLRQRRPGAGEGPGSTTVIAQKSSGGGVSLLVVLVIALIAFVLGKFIL
ncbi:PapD-like protein [Hyaloraphidium curvatum]|nr:PapD-like protein [Hyaloraphidium curvatum]